MSGRKTNRKGGGMRERKKEKRRGISEREKRVKEGR